MTRSKNRTDLDSKLEALVQRMAAPGTGRKAIRRSQVTLQRAIAAQGPNAADPARVLAGPDPLPAGHEISWGALSTNSAFVLSDRH